MGFDCPPYNLIPLISHYLGNIICIKQIQGLISAILLSEITLSIFNKIS